MHDSADPAFNRRFLAWFAVALVAAAMAYLACITFLPIPAANVRFADTVLGFVMGTVLATPIVFFFGSSKSSQVKDQALLGLAPPAVPPPPPPTPETTP